MKFLGLNESQWLALVLGLLCMVELLQASAPSFAWAFAGGVFWTVLGASLFIRHNRRQAPGLADSAR